MKVSTDATDWRRWRWEGSRCNCVTFEVVAGGREEGGKLAVGEKFDGLHVPPRGFDGDRAIKTQAATDAREDKGDRRADNVIFGGLETREGMGRADCGGNIMVDGCCGGSDSQK